MIARWIVKTFIEVVFWAGVMSSFMRTADLFQNFAPAQFGGYSTAGWYGIICAVSVESLILIAKYYYLLDPTRSNTGAYEFSVKAGIAAWLLSFAAQGLDGVIVRDALDTLSPIARDVIYWVVPATPLAVSGALMLFGSQLVGGHQSTMSVPKQSLSQSLAMNPMIRAANRAIGKSSRWLDGLWIDSDKSAEKPKAAPKVAPPRQTITQSAAAEADSDGKLTN
jgi:hypothetical protein